MTDRATKLKPQDVETIFQTARVNGGRYDGDQLISQRWEWPKGWLSKRLEEIRKEQSYEKNTD